MSICHLVCQATSSDYAAELMERDQRGERGEERRGEKKDKRRAEE